MNSVLICAIQKTGSTWIRFVMFNYFNILNNGATETLTFDELKKIHDVRRKKGFRKGHPHVNKEVHTTLYEDGFPQIIHTHIGYNGTAFVKNFPKAIYNKYFNQFDKIIYGFRNPYDTMISYHQFIFNRNRIPYRKINMNLKQRLEDFTTYYLGRFIKHVKETMHRADIVLNYDKLRKDPSGFAEAIKLVDGTIDMNVFSKAVEISTFDNIKKMSIEVDQPYGVGGPLYKGFFCRDGRSGQYKEVMSKELIEYITNECKKVNLTWEE